MIKSVVREHHWQPDVIESLYLDDMDFLGLIYWYNDVIEHKRQVKEESK